MLNTPWPHPSIEDRAAVIEWIRGNIGHIWHGMSSCKMGKEGDKSAVLDSRARVRGVTGLRVVDASSFPVAPPGHPMSSIYMFAEKIADSILSEDSTASIEAPGWLPNFGWNN